MSIDLNYFAPVRRTNCLRAPHELPSSGAPVAFVRHTDCPRPLHEP